MTSIVSVAENTCLVGHEEAEKLFLSAYNSCNLHHGWLIFGDKGIGKATFCYKLARFLLSVEDGKVYNNLDISPKSTVFKQVASGSHPDFRVLERDYTDTDKKKIIKAINQGEEISEEMKQGLKRSSVIKVEDVRETISFLMKKSFDNRWRVVIVDSVDDLNVSSANALLKILEEPPLKSILLLVAHNLQTVLPTIRSRCAKLGLKSLSASNTEMLLRRYRPDLSETAVQKLAQIASGSIGRALNYAENDAISMYQAIQKVCYQGAKCDGSLLSELANRAAEDDETWQLFEELICRFIRETLPDFERPRALYEGYENALKVLDETVRLNMDKRQAALQILGVLSAC